MRTLVVFIAAGVALMGCEREPLNAAAQDHVNDVRPKLEFCLKNTNECEGGYLEGRDHRLTLIRWGSSPTYSGPSVYGRDQIQRVAKSDSHILSVERVIIPSDGRVWEEAAVRYACQHAPRCQLQ